MKRLLLSLVLTAQPPVIIPGVCHLIYEPPPSRTVTLVQCDTVFSNGFD